MSKPIKIMYIISNADLYGSNKSLLNLLDMLTPHKVNPIVVMRCKGALCKDLQERGIPFFQLRYYYSIYPKLKNFVDFNLFIPILFRTLFYNYMAVKALKQLARQNEIDLIHTNIGPIHIGYQTAMKLNIPHVWHIREYQDLFMGWHPLFSNKSFIRKLNSKNNYPIANSRGILQHYLMTNNAKIIYNGVRKASDVRFCSSKEKYFLFVGRLEEGKGIRSVMEAFIEFAKNESEFKLLIAGEGTVLFKSILFQIADNAGMSNRIQFLGFRNDVNALMEKATAMIVSSSFEGFGNVTVEAMFNGCLVIGKNSGGTKEILENESYGILYNNQNELVNTLHRVVNKGIRSFFPTIINAQEKASKLYSFERNGEEVFSFYKEILSDKKGIQKILF